MRWICYLVGRPPGGGLVRPRRLGEGGGGGLREGSELECWGLGGDT